MFQIHKDARRLTLEEKKQYEKFKNSISEFTYTAVADQDIDELFAQL